MIINPEENVPNILKVMWMYYSVLHSVRTALGAHITCLLGTGFFLTDKAVGT
jgi:hypothetical protein